MQKVIVDSTWLLLEMLEIKNTFIFSVTGGRKKIRGAGMLAEDDELEMTDSI